MSTEVKKPEAFDFFGACVYNADELRDYDPHYFLGCSRGIRKIVDKKNIPSTEYCYGSQSKSGWKKCTSIYPKAKLLLKADWVHENVPKMADNKEVLYDVEPAPPVLELEYHEKFKNEHGKILDIEVRGERDPKNCYFKVSDVSREFGMDNLNDVITHKTGGYTESMHYKYFTCNVATKNGIDSTKTILKKALFLTYKGMIRVLYCSRSKAAERFQDWATEKLFTLQLGTKQQKEELVASALGVHVKAVRQVFSSAATTTPCIYLLTLNTVKELRSTWDIPVSYSDDALVCKYGQTCDLERRVKEHQTDYGRMKGVDLKLKLYSYVDPQFVSEAETDIRGFFADFNMKYEVTGRSELVIIEPAKLERVKKQYAQISHLYAGHYKELVQRLREVEKELETQKERHAMEIKLYQKDIEMRDQNIEALKTINALQQKLLEKHN
jgi:prophage antirepressor-like protein